MRHDFFALVRMIRAWARGDYTAVPRVTILAAIAAVLYFVLPLDAIADFIPVVGYVDDVFILSWVLGSIRQDVQDFVRWEHASYGVVDTTVEPRETA